MTGGRCNTEDTSSMDEIEIDFEITFGPVKEREGEREKEGGRERGREGGKQREGERGREGGRETERGEMRGHSWITINIQS